MRCFIDTNIWYYFFAETNEPLKTAQAKILLENPRIDIILSVQVVNELCSNLLRKARFDEGQIREIVSGFYSDFEIVDFTEEILLGASEIRVRHNFSYWDSLVIASALLNGAEILYSEDMQDQFVLERRLKIQNPLKM